MRHNLQQPRSLQTGLLSCYLELDQAAAEDQAAVEVQERSASLGWGIGFVDRAVEEDQAATTDH